MDFEETRLTEIPDFQKRRERLCQALLTEGKTSDHDLLRLYFKELFDKKVYPVATDQFLNKSKDIYNAPWLARELIQNFVDHNVHNPGTLDGVKITKQESTGGKVKFVIQGNWPYQDFTGLVSPHSEKPKGKHNAGGNGIGVKQAAIRLMRDFAVAKFEIKGEGWGINYKMVSALDANQVLPDGSKLKHEWLVAEKEDTQDSGTCSYTIETDNPELIEALDQLAETGVSATNPWLKNPDFSNEHGALKWLKLEEDKKANHGRLFLNGQVMHYQQKGKDTQNYWDGPEFVTIRLNNVDYEMSVDRPPLSSYQLAGYLGQLIRSMNNTELIEQIKKSEYLWTGMEDVTFGNRQACMVVINKLVDTLWHSREYKPEEFTKYFGSKKYLAREAGMTKDQVIELQTKGYVLCPEFFRWIGFPRAKTKLDPVGNSKKADLDGNRQQVRYMAQKYGLSVGYENLSSVKLEDLLSVLYERIAMHVKDWRKEDGKFYIEFVDKLHFPENILFHELRKPKKGDELQELLFFLRGAAFYGLQAENFLKSMYWGQKGYITTFSVEHDPITDENNLLVLSNENSNGTENFLILDLYPGLEEKFKSILARTNSKQSDSTKQKEETNVTQDKPEKIRKKSLRHGTRSKIAASLGLIVTILGAAEFDRIKEYSSKITLFGKGGKAAESKQISPKELEQSTQGIKNKLEESSKLVDELEKNIPPRAADRANSIEQYLKWKESENFYGDVGKKAGYVSSKSLFQILAEQEQAEIPGKRQKPEGDSGSEFKQLNKRLETLANHMKMAGELVEDFEIVINPEEPQLEQLALLREYVYLTTKYNALNDFFLFNGRGAKGLNMSSAAIGLHTAMLDVDLSEALGTVIHEIGHNYSMEHDADFERMTNDTWGAVHEQISLINAKLDAHQELSSDEQKIVDAERKWQEIQKERTAAKR